MEISAIEKKLISEFLVNLGLDSLDERDKIVKTAHAVSEIAWGEGRTVEDVFSKGVGTCTGKHKVLQACFDELGIKYLPVVATFKWGEQGIDYPEELQKILDEGEWEHGHNFVKLENGNYLDITWDPALQPLGFMSLPNDWTPEQSFIGVKNIKQQWDGVSIDEMKSQLINGLDQEIRERRERFLSGFIDWINSIRK